MKNAYMITFISAMLGVFFFCFLNFYNLENELLAKKIMLISQNIVKDKKPTPVQSSRFYALVASSYYDTVYIKNEKYIYSTSSLEKILDGVVKEDDQNIKTKPTGDYVWVDSRAPFSPNASSLSRFILDKDFKYQVPKPPIFMGEEYRTSLSIVKRSSESRTAVQSEAINFWGGVPGTEQPAGIWINRFYDVTKDMNLSDKEIAYSQKILTQTLADAFVECWTIKFKYWTKRPDMVDQAIETSMPNPPFPGYVSGHSTISFAAATVLSKMFPSKKDIFINDAEEAKNSRLWAGIHFPHDNEEGEKLGKAVGEFVISKIGI